MIRVIPFSWQRDSSDEMIGPPTNFVDKSVETPVRRSDHPDDTCWVSAVVKTCLRTLNVIIILGQ